MKKEKGYAFVELLATIAIVSIMSAVVLSSLSAPRAAKSVETEARKLAAVIREAQSYALSGKQDEADTVCGWGIYYDSGSSNYDYKLFYNKDTGSGCGAVLTDYDEGSYSVNSANYSLESGVKFDSGSKEIYFKIPYGNIYDADSVLIGNIKITIVSEADASKKYSVCLYSSGMVTEKVGDVGC